MVLHGVCAAALLAAAPWTSGEAPLARMGEGEAIEVTLVSASTDPAAASGNGGSGEPKSVVAQAFSAAEAPAAAPPSPSSGAGAEGRAQCASPEEGAAASDARPGAIDPAAGADYRERLLAHIQPFRRYPAQAHARDADARGDARGIVQLVFMVDKGGSVMGVWVKTSSGVEILDAEAVATILRAQPMPRVPPGLPAPLMVQLPVSFNPS